MTTEVDKILEERGSRYGKFKDHAAITGRFKDIIDEFDFKLSRSQKEALDMIAHKISRILNGDPNYADSWLDLAGYAMLVVHELNGETK